MKVVQHEQVEGVWSPLSQRPLWWPVRVFFGESIWTVGSTIFEMWLELGDSPMSVAP